MSRIELNFVATGDFKAVQTQINALRNTVQQLNKEVGGIGFDAGRISQIRAAVAEYDKIVQSTGAFTRQTVQLDDATTKFGRSLQDNKLKLNDYFRIAREGARATQGEMRALAEQQVRLQNSIIRTDPFNAGRVMVDTPRQIDTVSKATEIARTQMGLYNLALKNGAGELINWGKNTQWAGRQLTVGLTVPITLFGKTASDVFMKFDQQLTRMAKVYGSGLSPATKQVTDSMRAQVTDLSKQLATSLGQSVDTTAAIAADVAATGMEGKDLLNATLQTSRLATLGEIDRQDAMKATISLQNVFKLNTNQLTESINFLNAVENQTSTSLQDIVTAIPKAAPVVKQLGGNFKEVAVMMVAMREAGVPASEAANAIKSALGSVINPSKKTSEELDKVGINLRAIVDTTNGDPVQTFMLLGKELDKLGSLERARAIENVFGKFQFARVSALLANLGKEGSQTQKVFELMGATAAQTAKLADAELKAQAESVSGRYQRALMSMQAALVPFGQKFTEFATKMLEIFTTVAEFVNSNEGLKTLLTIVAGVTAFIGPVIMLTGVFANFFGYMFKGIATIKNFMNGFKNFGSVATAETVAAQSAVELFTEKMMGEAGAIDTVTVALQKLNEQLAVMTTKQEALTAQQLVSGPSAAATAAQSTAQAELLRAAGYAGYSPKSGAKNVTFMHLSPRGSLGQYEKTSGTAGVFLPTTDMGGEAAALQARLNKEHDMSETLKLRESQISEEMRANLFRAQMGAKMSQQEIEHIIANKKELLKLLYLSADDIRSGAGQYLASMQVLQQRLKSDPKEFSRIMSEVSAKLEAGQGPEASRMLRDAATKYGAEMAEFENALNQIMIKVIQSHNPALTLAEIEASLPKVGGKGGSAASILSAGMLGIPAPAAPSETSSNLAALEEEVAMAKQELIDSDVRLAEANDKLRVALEEQAKAISASEAATLELNDVTDKNSALYQEKLEAQRLANEKLNESIATANLYEKEQKDLIREEEVTKKQLKELIVVREAEIASEIKLTDANNAAAEAAIADSTPSTQEPDGGPSGPPDKKKGRFGRLLGKIGGGMGLAIGASMLTSYLQNQMSEEQKKSGYGQAVGAAGTVSEFAGTGMMFGPYGAAAGAALGLAKALKDVNDQIIENNKEFSRKAKMLTAGLDEASAAQFGVQMKSLADIHFDETGRALQGATSNIKEFAKAVKDAADDTALGVKRQALAGTATAKEYITSAAFQSDLQQFMISGNKKGASEYFGGLLMGAGKIDFSGDVQRAIDQAFSSKSSIGKRLAESMAGRYEAVTAGSSFSKAQLGALGSFNKLAAGQDLTINGLTVGAGDILAQFASQKDRLKQEAAATTHGARVMSDADLLKTFLSENITVGGPEGAKLISSEQTKALVESLTPLLGKSKEDIAALAQELGKADVSSKELGTSLVQAFTNLPAKDYADVLDGLNAKSVDLTGASQNLEGALRAAGYTDAANGIAQLAKNGASADSQFKALTITTSNLGFSFKELQSMSDLEINAVFRYTIEYTEAQNAAKTAAQKDAAALAAKYAKTGTSDKKTTGDKKANGDGGSSGPAPRFDSKPYDKAIEAQRQIIDGINKERDARQKLAQQQKDNQDFLINEMSLKRKMAESLATGDLMSYYESQVQLGQLQQDKIKADDEKRKQAEEDRRVAAAEAEIKRIEKRKQAAQEAFDAANRGGAGGAGGGGGAATGGGTEAAGPSEAAITSALAPVVNSDLMFGSKKDFQKSILFTSTVKGLQKLGISYKDAFKAVSDQWDELNNKSAIAKNKLLDMGDPRITSFVNGWNDATKDAFKDLTPDSAAKLKTKFYNEMLHGKKPEDALKDLSTGLYKTIYDNGIKKGLDPVSAQIAAATAAQEMNKEFTIKSDIDQILNSGVLEGLKPDQIKAISSAAAKAANDGVITNTELETILQAGIHAGLDPQEAKVAAGKAANAVDTYFKNNPSVLQVNATLVIPVGTIINTDVNGKVQVVRTSGGRNVRIPVVHFAHGGYISGPGGPKDDLIPAMLSNGEFVVSADAVKHYGNGMLNKINKKKFAMGGKVMKYATGGNNGGGGSTNTQQGDQGGDNQGANVTGPSGVIKSAKELMKWATQFIGLPYNNSEKTGKPDGPKNGFGCSPFTAFVLRKGGVSTPAYSPSQMNQSKPVEGTPYPGDLLFWQFPWSSKQFARAPGEPNHVGFYYGSGQMLHSSGGAGTHISSLSGEYSMGGKNFLRAGRLLPNSSFISPLVGYGVPTEFDQKMKIPGKFHRGGVVGYSKGGEVLAMVQGGEVVVPVNTVDKVNPLLDALTSGKMGIGDITNNITINGANHSPKVIAEMVVGEIEKSMKRTVNISRVM